MSIVTHNSAPDNRFEIKESYVKKLAPKIQEIMESVVSEKERRGIPIIAKGRAGKNWGAMEEL